MANYEIETITRASITIEAHTFWNKRASSITIITDENKTRNASEQDNEFA